MAESYNPVNPRAPWIWHGGDYNPEQWPAEVWDEDVALMQRCGFNVATVGVFSWVTLQPAEDRYDFGWLDDVVEKLHAGGRRVCLATPTAAQPAWMSRAYPDVLRSDETGRRRHHGGRTNFCPNSPSYRRFAVQIATLLAQRYGQHPALVLWHISNEYAGGGLCYCESCAAAFRTWLLARYPSLDELNARWWTRFWSHTYGDWSEIEPPYADGESVTHGLTLDYRRFQSDSFLECYRLERDAIRAISPDVPITTNLMGTFPLLDYRAWARELDVIAWDCYPRPDGSPAEIAFLHDLNRGLKDGQPFLLLEQTPSSQNWQPVNALKRPGVLRLWSYQAIAHGSDSVMYFQWRRGRGGGEKLHGAVVEHGGRSDTRVFREVAGLGAELERLGSTTLGAGTPARAAVVFDWDNWWALDAAIGPINPKDYVGTVRRHYAALWRKNIPVDIVFADSDLSRYDLLLAPMLYMVKPGLAQQIEALVRRGGIAVVGTLSGRVDEHDLAFEGYPGPLRALLGLRIEEVDALYPGQHNRIIMHDDGSYVCGTLCDIVHCEGAQVLAIYGDDFYAGTPAVTEHAVGQGSACYLASEPDDHFLDDFYGRLLERLGIAPLLQLPPGVELALREQADRRLAFVLNHNAAPATLQLPADLRAQELLSGRLTNGTLTLPAYGVAILGARG